MNNGGRIFLPATAAPWRRSSRQQDRELEMLPSVIKSARGQKGASTSHRFLRSIRNQLPNVIPPRKQKSHLKRNCRNLSQLFAHKFGPSAGSHFLRKAVPSSDGELPRD